MHIALAQSNVGDYKIVNSEILNKFRVSHKKQNFICHFVGEGSNHISIKSYIESLSNETKGVLVKESLIPVTFKEKDAVLNFRIFKQEDLYILKYTWDFTKLNIENLSHSFVIQEGNSKRQIDFNSEYSGSFEFYKFGDIKIYHSYNWFNQFDWKQIV
jgi:hypothetical protein